MTVVVADEQDHPVPLARLRALGEQVMALEGVPAAMELTIVLVDEAAIAELNQTHLGGEGPTDVLAFPLDAPDEPVEDVPALLGDVVLCPAVAQRQAPAAPVAELEMLVVHGILHLLGHDHAEADERETMFDRTDELLAAFRDDHGPAPAHEPAGPGGALRVDAEGPDR